MFTPSQPGLVDLAGVVDAVGRPGAGLEGDLGQAHRVGGVGRADHDHQVGLRADLLDGELAVLGGVADVVARRVEQVREPLPDGVDGGHRLVDRERRLREPGDLLGVAHDDPGDVVGALHELDVLGSLTGGALDLLVTLVADQQDVVVVAGEALRLVVHLGHQRAGGVDRLQAALGRLLVDQRARRRGPRRPRWRPRGPRRAPRRRRHRVTPGRRPRACCARSACARRPATRRGPAPSPR